MNKTITELKNLWDEYCKLIDKQNEQYEISKGSGIYLGDGYQKKSFAHFMSLIVVINDTKI